MEVGEDTLEQITAASIPPMDIWGANSESRCKRREVLVPETLFSSPGVPRSWDSPLLRSGPQDPNLQSPPLSQGEGGRVQGSSRLRHEAESFVPATPPSVESPGVPRSWTSPGTATESPHAAPLFLQPLEQARSPPLQTGSAETPRPNKPLSIATLRRKRFIWRKGSHEQSHDRIRKIQVTCTVHILKSHPPHSKHAAVMPPKLTRHSFCQ